MPTRERPVDRATRIADGDLVRIGNDIRNARVGAGLSLATVGRSIGLSASQVSRIERFRAPSVTVRQLARIGAIVGLDIRVRTYPGPDPLRDIAQTRLLGRLRQRLHPDLVFRTEVPLPEPGDQRAWDGWIGGLRDGTPLRRGLPVEAETRVDDFQAMTRRLTRKMRDSDTDHVLLLVADTRANRLGIAAAGGAVTQLFPTTPRRALAALASGSDPGGSAIIFL